MANRAVAEPGISQVVKCRRNATQVASRIQLRAGGHVGVALQARKPDLMPVQHPRVRGAVWVVARPAVIRSHRRGLEREGPARDGMALKTAGVVGGDRLDRSWPHCAVRIVAIDT